MIRNEENSSSAFQTYNRSVEYGFKSSNPDNINISSKPFGLLPISFKSSDLFDKISNFLKKI